MHRPTDTSRPIAGYLLALSGAVLFASKGIFIKLAYAEGIDAETLLVLRMALSVPVFLAVAAWTVMRGHQDGREPVGPALFLKASLVGIVGYWYASYADFKGLETLTPQFERLILFTYPLFVVLLGALFFRQRFNPRAVLGFLIAYAGLAVVFVADSAEGGGAVAIGAAWVLSCAVAFALYQLLAAGIIRRIGSPVFTAIGMSAAGAVLLAQFLIGHDLEDLAVGGRGLAIALGLALVATVAPSYLMNAALTRISAQANATMGMLSPVVTLLLAAVILGETVTAADIAGTALVLAGVGLFTLIDRRRPVPE